MIMPDDGKFMARALELAQQGRGQVEPNPLVGCVLVVDGQVVGEGYHERFGRPHAEVRALEVAGAKSRGSTAYVTLEPCCHYGQTPPCVDALLAAGVQRVVAAHADPFPRVAGGGFERLRSAGVEVEIGLLGDEARELNAPYLKRLATGRPWIIAKWAMSLDGKIATATGASRWISGVESRGFVHELRGRVDAILIGSRTALLDDPLLTARPSGPRLATRVVLDSEARLSLDSQLVRTAREVPLLVVVGAAASVDRRMALEAAGCELFQPMGRAAADRLAALLDELGRRHWTNVLVEGGAQVLGSFFALRAVDEVHVFVAPLVIGGETAPGAVAGVGAQLLADATRLSRLAARPLGDDIHLTGR